VLRVLPMIFSLLLPFSIFAQQQSYVFQQLTTKDGLLSDEVTGIFHDSKNFTWVGTKNGLQKFEGKDFTNISLDKKHQNNNVLATGILKPVLEDSLGNIWCLNHGFISVYNPLTGKTNNINILDDPRTPYDENIRSFCKDELNNIWILTGINLYKYNSRFGKPILWLPVQRDPDYDNITNIIYDSGKKGLWLARGMNVSFADIQRKKITDLFYAGTAAEKMSHYKNLMSSWWMDSKKNIWLGNYDGLLYKYNTETGKTDVYNLNRGGTKSREQTNIITAYCFTEDSKGTIWIGSWYGGLFYYNEPKNSIEHIPADNNFPFSFHSDYYISDLSKDSEGNIWAGTDKGISIFNPSFQKINTLDENNLLQPFKKSEVTQIFETTSEDILVSTWGRGWFIYDKNFRLKTQFYYNKGLYNQKNLVWCFTEDHKGKIWIGYQYGLVGIFDTTSQQVHYINVPEFNQKTIKSIQCDSKGNIWFGLNSGYLGKWDVIKNKFIVYKSSYLPSPNAQGLPISNVLITRQGEIWLATRDNGFCRFDADKEKIVEKYMEKKEGPLFETGVISLTEINDSVIGVATFSKGCLLFNKKQKTFTSITKQDGLPLNMIYGLAQDKQKNIWIATTDGLFYKNRSNNKLVTFNEEDGLLNKHFQGNILTTHDGRMAVPTTIGLVYFAPDEIKALPPPNDVQITNFKVFDKSLLIDSVLSGNKTIQLDHSQNFITIGYASPGFLGRNTTQYFYQLQGIDKDWVKAGTQHSAGYTNVSPGRYVFKVRCENRDGMPSKKITFLSINVQPPWWFTWWAYCLYALFATGIAYTWYRNHINQLEEKQAAQLKAMVATQEEERKRISRDLHDDIGTKLSALKLFISSLQEKATQTNNEEIKSLAISSEQFITEAVKEVRQLLLNLSPSVLEEFGYTTAVEGLINKINETRLIYFNLVIFGMKHRLKKEYELALYRITQELINNVLKHAEAKQVSLQIGQRDEKIILMMEDNGKGFDVSSRKDGYGLHNLEARTKLMQGIMTIDSMPGKGTSVLIEVPYKSCQL
jgi:signal transduction histidine kinase/ligand-binding sensor domain-containing protein